MLNIISLEYNFVIKLFNVMKTKKILHIVFALISVAIDIFLIVEASMSGGDSGAQSLGFTDFIINIIRTINPNSILLNDLDTLHVVIRKLFGHFLAFGATGLFTTLSLVLLSDAFSRKKVRIAVISASIGLFLALLTEGIQLLTPGRAGQFQDVGIDFGGFLLFAGLIYLVSYLIYTNKMNQSKERSE